MKTLFRTLLLWAALATVCWLIAGGSGSDLQQFFAACGLFLLPPLAVWSTAKVAANPPNRLLLRILFWTVTIAGWLAVILLAQGRWESGHADQRQNLLLASGFAVLAAAWFIVKTRSFPTWRGLREAAAGVAVLALAGAAFFLICEARTKTVIAQAEARWTAIGMPMAEFEKTLAPGRESAGSQVVRQILREQVGTRFYKEGTAAAEREPSAERTPEMRAFVDRAGDIISAKLPPSDDLDLSALPVAAIEPAGSELEAAYERILASEPATWATDPRDGFLISVPNFLGVRMFSQLTAADAMRRISTGDQVGAARAIDAGRRVSESLRENPTLVSLMIHIAIDAMLAPKQVRLPAQPDAFASIARDVTSARAEFFRRLQIESWACLRFSEQIVEDESLSFPGTRAFPKWVRRITDRPAARWQCAIGALAGAEYAAIIKSPATLTLPDFGASLQEAIIARHRSMMVPNYTRAGMRIHATLLLREQTELIRDARARLAAGRTVEARDSAVLPGLRWELIADVEKNTVATRLAGAPEWIVKGDVTGDDFWLLPLDGSVAWQFRTPAQTASRF